MKKKDKEYLFKSMYKYDHLVNVVEVNDEFVKGKYWLLRDIFEQMKLEEAYDEWENNLEWSDCNALLH